MITRKRFSPEVGKWAGRMLFEHQGEYDFQWAAINSIAGRTGCSAESLRRWVRQTEIDQGIRNGVTTPEREPLKQLEKENRELKPANEILRKASAYPAEAELERRPK